MNYVEGVDVSHWQGDIEWNKLFAAGPKYCFIRAGSCNINTGACYTDWEFDSNSSFGPEYLPCGPYWFFRAEHNPIIQARYFYNISRTADWKLPYVCDVEVNRKADGKTISKREFSNSLRKFLNEIERLSGRRPIIYTNQNFDNMVEDNTEWGTYDLWVASYTLNSEPNMPKYWSDYTFWQWSADRPPTANKDGWKYGCPGSTAIDKNRFPGTWADFLAYIKEDYEPPPEPPPPVFLPYIAKVSAPRGLFTRKTPAGSKAGALFNNTEVEVIAIEGTWRQHRSVFWSHGDFLKPV